MLERQTIDGPDARRPVHLRGQPANNENALTHIDAFTAAVEAFVAAPSADGLTTCRTAWIVAHQWYAEAEYSRFYSGPVVFGSDVVRIIFDENRSLCRVVMKRSRKAGSIACSLLDRHEQGVNRRIRSKHVEGTPLRLISK